MVDALTRGPEKHEDTLQHWPLQLLAAMHVGRQSRWSSDLQRGARSDIWEQVHGPAGCHCVGCAIGCWKGVAVEDLVAEGEGVQLGVPPGPAKVVLQRSARCLEDLAVPLRLGKLCQLHVPWVTSA